MDLQTRHAFLTILREGDLEKVATLPLNRPKGSAHTGLVRTLWGAAKGGADEAGRLAEPALGGMGRSVLKYAPHAALAFGGYKALTSSPVQRARYKAREWNQRRQQKKMMRAAGGYY
jgi:hypothetical protein